MTWAELGGRSRNDAIRAWAIAKKDVRIYYLKPPVIIFGTLMPVFLFLAFMVRRNMDAAALIPGLMAMTVFFGSSTVTSATIPWEKGQGTYDRLLVAPVSLLGVMAGKAMAGLLFGLLVSLVPLVIGMAAFGMAVRAAWLLPVGLFVSACTFASLGVLMASAPGRTVGDIMMLGNLVRLPLIFVSGIFIPLQDLPGWARGVAFASPLTYANNLMRASISGDAYLAAPAAVAALLGFWAVFLLAGAKLHAIGKKA
ncbi:MAG: ABC transporter permease [Gemmatimonadetes bacterium]|nr:ABC transporter permease [Gemmatimonadota bacterium]